MRFSFNVNLSDEDYLEYNKFVLLRSPYGKKELIKFRIIFAAFFVFIFLISFFGSDTPLKERFIGMIPTFVLFLLFEIFLSKFYSFLLKRTIKSKKKAGKLAYTEKSQLEFYDDNFVETYEDGKTERQYSAIERISIVEGKYLYIHINASLGYILPQYVFSSDDCYKEFVGFITEKCSVVNKYR